MKKSSKKNQTYSRATSLRGCFCMASVGQSAHDNPVNRMSQHAASKFQSKKTRIMLAVVTAIGVWGGVVVQEQNQNTPFGRVQNKDNGLDVRSGGGAVYVMLHKPPPPRADRPLDLFYWHHEPRRPPEYARPCPALINFRPTSTPSAPLT